MGNIFVSLTTAANALSVFERSLDTVQNNVSNASTPGFAKQRQTLEARPFDPAAGIPGGVRAGALQSFRSRFAEEAVRRQQELVGRFSQRAADLAAIEPVFDISGGAGIPGALNQLFEAFSQLTIAPNDSTARQAVLNRANDLADSFNATAESLTNAAVNADRQAHNVVDQINVLVAQITQLNRQRRQNFSSGRDPASEAQLHNTLEELSELANITVLDQDDGGVAVYLGGQTLLVIGDRGYPVSVDSSNGRVTILDSGNNDVTAQVTGGRLSALIEERNILVPSLLADLNRLAETVADQINATLSAGVDQTGVPPLIDLFTYDNVSGSALTLATNPLTPGQLAAALPSAPGGNGNILNVAALSGAALIDGFTLTGFYGILAARAGRELVASRETAATQNQLLLQTQSLRQELSGVSLDEEAAHLIAFQRAYQATSQLFRVLNELTAEAIALLR